MPDERAPCLHVPAPAIRPGDTPDFSHVAIPRAGAVDRPDPATAPEEMRDLAFSIIRVLNRKGEAVGPWNPDLNADALLRGLRDMMKLRIYDARMMTAQRQGKTSFYMQHLGEEAISCAFQRALRKGDMNFPTYRQAGLLIASGYPMVKMMNQVYSNDGDPVRGRQLPVFYSSRDHGFFSISGNLATQYPQAVGWAMAAAIRGEKHLAAAWIGDGSTAESDFHGALVFASTYKPPVILNIVNNQWAISTFQGIARGGAGTFAARGHGFGLPALRVDGNDYLAVYAAAQWATERARADLGPTIIEFVTYRGIRHLSRGGAFHLGRSVGLSAQGRGHRLAAGRPDPAVEGTSDRPWHLERGASRPGRGRDKGRSRRCPERGRGHRDIAFGPPPVTARHVRGCLRDDAAASDPPAPRSGILTWPA